MPFVNATPFTHVDAPMLDRNGRDIVVVVLKGTFLVLGHDRVELSDYPVEVRLDDVPRDPSSPTSSALYPSDLCLEKRGTDVVVVGDAVARTRVTMVDVAIRVGTRTVPLRVHGIREYFRGLMEIAISASVPFEQMPITYERAFGGSANDYSYVEHRNPAGVGIASTDAALIGTLAPQIEHPAFPHKTSKERHPPIGCGSLLPHWSPRREHAGTFDEVHRATRFPLMPLDFDPRFNNVAHPSLVFDEPLLAGDPVQILGMSHDLFSFAIPAVPLVLRARYDHREEEVRPSIDTVVVEPRLRRFEIVMRGVFPIGRRGTALREIRADLDE
jgi:hypothetical protein